MVLSCLCIALASAGQEAPAEPEVRPEIIVTGERVPRTLRETASSVQVVTQRDIEAQGANRVDDLLALVPNVQLGNGSQGPTIRGLDTTGPLYALPAFLGGNRPRTTIVVDGRPTSYNEFVFGAFPVWDVNRVEVFRTPQTTTRGQNSIAGAIIVNTNDPAKSPEYRARAIAGDFRLRHLSALASGPLAGPDIAFRLAGDLRYARTTSRIEDVMRGADPNHDVYGLLRAKLLLEPSQRTRLTLTYAHTRSQAPQVVGVDAPFRERRDDSVGYGLFRVRTNALTAALRHRAAGDLTAELLVTGGQSKARRYAFPGFGETINDGRDWSAEAVVNWSPSGPLRAIAGFSRTHLGLRQFIDLSLLSGAIGRFRDWQDGMGAFGDATLALSEEATLSAGVRYQRDRQKRVGALAASGFTVPIDYVGAFDAWLPKVSLAYDVTPGLRLGALVQKAFNPGGTTIRVDTLRPDDFRAESLWDYELFARASFAGGRASAAANLFRYDMRDAQRAQSILIFTPTGRPVGFANLFNVPRARSRGVEAEIRWRMSSSLSWAAGAGLLDTRILEPDSEGAALAGKQFDRSPRFSGSAAIEWQPADPLRLAAQVRHHSGYFSDPRNSPGLRIDSGTTVNARAEYRLGRATLFAQVRNLFDALNLRDLATPTSGEAEDPRMVSIGLDARF
ncbi:MAG TPA: TonB-dependent receptor [Sphingomicrobium sp.]|nr:TonB-dependent receptor [Sphingomicrobium sp.]